MADRITALANRELATAEKAAVNHNRIFPLMRQNALLISRHAGIRTGRVYVGTAVIMRSNLRWCSYGFEVTCWNGEVIRAAFIIDAHNREIIAWHDISAGISGDMVRDMMMKAVETQFGGLRAHQLSNGTDNGSAYTAEDTATSPSRSISYHASRPSQARVPTAWPRASSKPSSATMFASPSIFQHYRQAVQRTAR